jgi:hypothetical protein
VPGSFTYRSLPDPSAALVDKSQRLWLVMNSTDQAVGTLTLSGTGTVSVPGLGFQPDVIVLTSARKAGASSHCQYAVGCADANAQWSYGINVRHATSPENFTRWREDACFTFITSGGFGVISERIRAVLDSLDADGFTLDVEQHDLGVGLTVGYLALAGNFKVGMASIPTSTGTQELSGIGFAPKGVWLASAPGHDDLSIAAPVYDRKGWDVCNGFASDMAGISQEAMWGGARHSGVPNRSASRWEHVALLLGLGPSGSTTWTIRCRAEADAFLSDSFRLDWTTVDGVANRRFAYLACDEAEAGSFQITSDPSGGADLDVVVPTEIEPRSMISTSTGYNGLSGATMDVVPDEFMQCGHGYLGFGASEPWALFSGDELCSGLGQSSGGPSGGGYPTCKCFLRTGYQGFSYWHDNASGSIDSTLVGQAFDVWEARAPLRIPSLNARIDAKRMGSATRALLNPSDT